VRSILTTHKTKISISTQILHTNPFRRSISPKVKSFHSALRIWSSLFATSFAKSRYSTRTTASSFTLLIIGQETQGKSSSRSTWQEFCNIWLTLHLDETSTATPYAEWAMALSEKKMSIPFVVHIEDVDKPANVSPVEDESRSPPSRPFLSLPAEIRNHIYSQLMPETTNPATRSGTNTTAC
jgi:hypothetical protein